MRKICRDLVPGDIVSSGEEVVRVTKVGGMVNNKKALVLLKKDGKHRIASWGWYSTIFMKKITTQTLTA